MKKLSPKMQEVLEKMEYGKTYYAYTLHVSLATLFALVNRGLLDYKIELGAGWYPRSSIKFWRKQERDL